MKMNIKEVNRHATNKCGNRKTPKKVTKTINQDRETTEKTF